MSSGNLPVSDFIDGMHHPFDVILGPAPGFGSNGTRHVSDLFDIPFGVPTISSYRTQPRWLSTQTAEFNICIMEDKYADPEDTRKSSVFEFNESDYTDLTIIP